MTDDVKNVKLNANRNLEKKCNWFTVYIKQLMQ